MKFNIELPGIEVSMGAEIMDMGKYDLIVGMEYLIPAKAFIDCAARKVILTTPNGKQIEIAGNEVVPIMRCMSMEKLLKGIKKQQIAYVFKLKAIDEPKREGEKESLLVELPKSVVDLIKEFYDAFPDEIEKLPPTEE